jgi:RNA polymerase sigma-70 factor, ECF subfamily
VATVIPLRRPTPPEDDAELVARAIAGDESAREALFVRHAPGVLQMAERVLRDPIEAEDVVQQTFEIAYGTLHRVANVSSLRPWLLTIAVRRCHRIFRRRKIARFFGFDETHESLVEHAIPGLDPERRAELALVDVALSRAPHKARVAWMLRHVEDLPLEECATICACSLATVKRWIGSVDELLREHTGADRGE